MSAPVRIPPRRGARASGHSDMSPPSASSSYGSPGYTSASPSSSSSHAGTNSMPRVSSPLVPRASGELGSSVDSMHKESPQSRRASLMSSSLAASEHTVINVGGPDALRLITCVRSSQGFDWNQEIFLPSRYDGLVSSDLERKRDPVIDIYLTDEEMQGILPQ